MKTTGKIRVSMLILAAGVAGIISCNRTTKEAVPPTENKEYVSMSEYNSMVAAKNATEDTLYQTINQVDNGLRTIRENEGLMAGTAPESMSKKDAIMRTIGEIGSLLEQNREKIKKLTGQLASLRSQKAKWKKESAEMKQAIGDREAELGHLQQEVADQTSTINYLNQIVAELKDANTVSNDQVKKMDRELHKAYYTLGSYKELKAHNVVERTGGVLGLGRTEEMKPDFEKEYFKPIDTREVTSIAVNGKKPKLITHHPVGSYEWEKANDNANMEYLTIKDPERFWAASKYLVVEVR